MKSDPLKRPLHVLSAGPFGSAIAKWIRYLCAATAETKVTDNTLPMAETWPQARAHVVASWRPVPELCALADELCYRWELPFIPVIADRAIVRVGPLIIRGLSCWTCWTARARQHEPWLAEQEALLEFYTQHPTSGPGGFLEPFALMAATRLFGIIDSLDRNQAVAGTVWEINLLNGAMRSGVLNGVHDCPRCGTLRPPATRTVLDLSRELNLFSKEAARIS